MLTYSRTDPTHEPLSLTELKDHLRVVTTAEDTLLTSIGEAATRYAETRTNRQFMRATYTLKCDGFPRDSEAIELPRPPLQSVTSITYVDADGASQTLSSSVYTVDTDSEPGRVYLAYDQTWPVTRDIRHSVTITYVAGYSSSGDIDVQRAAIPDGVKHICRLFAASMWEHREARLDYQTYDNVAAECLIGAFRVTECL